MTSFLDAIRLKISNLVPTPEPTREAKPTSFFCCNGCGATIASGEQRYVCIECKGLDLCKSCYKKELKYFEKNKKNISKDKNNNSNNNNKEIEKKDKDNEREEKRDGDIYLNLTPDVYHSDKVAPFPHRFTVETRSQVDMTFANKGETFYESLQNSFREHKARLCIGTRKKVEVSERYPCGLGEFEWLTFEEFQKETEVFGKALASIISSRSFIGICANNCFEWYCADIASLWYGMVVVPIHHQTKLDAYLEILSNSELSAIVISKEAFHLIVELVSSGKYNLLKLIVHIEDDFDQELRNKLPSGVQFKLFSEMMNIGRKVKKINHNPFGPDDIISLNYSSGSTGVPKGIISLDKEYNLSIVQSYVEYPSAGLSFLTLSHSQRRFDHKMLYQGGMIGIFSGSMDTLFDDLKELRPHTFWGVPRIWNFIYSQYQTDLEQFRKMNPNSSKEFCEEKVLKKFSGILGNRVRSIVTGGAPTSADVMEFMRRCWPHTPISNSYGLTEAIGIFVDGYISDDVQYRIDPAPEFGYYPTDLPNPRGELVVKSKTMSIGYYKNEQLTNESFVDGWFRTGDIVEQIGYRKIKIIDRKKNAFKLSNGEFVAPEPLENVFLGRTQDMIEQIFIYGDTLKTFLVAVVIPKKSVLVNLGLDYKNITTKELENNLQLKSLIMNEIQRIAIDAKLASYEIPKIITIDNTVWTTENELITGSGKYCRGKLAKFYKDRIDALYSTIDSIQKGLRDLNNSDSNSENATNLVHKYITSVLGIDTNDISELDLSKLNFSQLGGDSVGAIKLSNLLKEKENIDISPSMILNKNNNISDIFNKDIGENKLKEKINWDLEMKFDSSIQKYEKQVKVIKSTGNNVFLTGATGFLGSYLLADLLLNQSSVGDIYCLVRGTKDLIDSKKKLVDQLTNKYKIELSETDIERIVPVMGDLEQDMLGMDEASFISLAEKIDVIINNGAIVNMVTPYTNMKNANVNGTQEILRLSACSNMVIPVAHISTIGTYSERFKVLTEADRPTLRNLDYMGGYNQSKLIAEQLVYEAKERGLPVILFRPGTIYANSVTGIDNDNDFVRMIIRGMMYMKSYPELSPLIGGGGGMFNLSPVDWVSSSIVSLSLQNEHYCITSDEPQVFHMVNENTISLEEICQSLKDEGVSKISHSEWMKKLNESTSENPLYSMKMVFKEGSFPGFGKYGYNNPQTIAALEKINKVGCPKITKNIITKNVEYLKSL